MGDALNSGLGRWDPVEAGTMRDLLADLGAPWWIAGGRALDLFLGKKTRDHDDLDIEILRREAPRLHDALPGWEHYAARAGALTRWRAGEPLPRQVHGLWSKAPGRPGWAVEFVLAEADGGDWVFRPCPAVRRPLDDVGLIRDGLPIVAPELVLLFKAKNRRPKDEDDFAVTLPALEPHRRAWLREALETAHPDHVWIERLR